MKTKVVLGIVLGAIFLFVATLVMIAFLAARPALQKASQANERNAALGQVKKVATGLVLAGAKTKTFPKSLEGIDLGGLPLQLNPKLAGVSFKAVKNPAKTVLVYEGAPGAPLYSHGGKAALGFADGHARMMNAQTVQAQQLRWEPETR